MKTCIGVLLTAIVMLPMAAAAQDNRRTLRRAAA